MFRYLYNEVKRGSYYHSFAQIWLVGRLEERSAMDIKWRPRKNHPEMQRYPKSITWILIEFYLLLAIFKNNKYQLARMIVFSLLNSFLSPSFELRSSWSAMPWTWDILYSPLKESSTYSKWSDLDFLLFLWLH